MTQTKQRVTTWISRDVYHHFRSQVKAREMSISYAIETLLRHQNKIWNRDSEGRDLDAN